MRRTREETPVSIPDVVCKHATDKALLVTIEDVDYWIPHSQVHDDSEVFDADDNATGTLVITAWIAREKGLA